MKGMSVVPLIQTAIGPVILISGIGLLLLTMTNRLGRAIDRARVLVSSDRHAEPHVALQLKILWVRANLLRMSILSSGVAALCAALIVILLFAAALWSLDLGWLIGSLFIFGMLALIVSLVLFIRDVNQSLEALKYEMDRRAVKP